jgi:hypothetical protein
MSAWDNIWIRDGDQWNTVFKTIKGLFEPTVMFFGMCNSLVTFQSMMDDIFLFAKTPKELENNRKKVLQCLRENDLFLKPKSANFKRRRWDG